MFIPEDIDIRDRPINEEQFLASLNVGQLASRDRLEQMGFRLGSEKDRLRRSIGRIRESIRNSPRWIKKNTYCCCLVLRNSLARIFERYANSNLCMGRKGNLQVGGITDNISLGSEYKSPLAYVECVLGDPIQPNRSQSRTQPQKQQLQN